MQPQCPCIYGRQFIVAFTKVQQEGSQEPQTLDPLKTGGLRRSWSQGLSCCDIKFNSKSFFFFRHDNVWKSYLIFNICLAAGWDWEKWRCGEWVEGDTELQYKTALKSGMLKERKLNLNSTKMCIEQKEGLRDGREWFGLRERQRQSWVGILADWQLFL